MSNDGDLLDVSHLDVSLQVRWTGRPAPDQKAVRRNICKEVIHTERCRPWSRSVSESCDECHQTSGDRLHGRKTAA
jgi:hypothetical protein